MKMHLKIKQFQCQHCEKSFTQKCNYNKHLRTHMVPKLRDRKTFQCTICYKKYTQAYNLRVSASIYEWLYLFEWWRYEHILIKLNFDPDWLRKGPKYELLPIDPKSHTLLCFLIIDGSLSHWRSIFINFKCTDAYLILPQP